MPTAPAVARGRPTVRAVSPTPRTTRGLRAILAVVAGATLGLCWQPYGLWGLSLVALPAFTLAVRGLSARSGLLLGYLFGLALLTVTIPWVSVLGAWVAALLILFEAAFFALLGGALALVTRLPGWPVAAACCWTATEFAYAHVPFGGFGWVRLGYAAVDSPLAGLYPIVGVAGVSFAVALSGQLVAYALVALRAGRRRAVRAGLAAAAGLVMMTAAGTALRLFQVEPVQSPAGRIAVGIVQGNVPGRGIEAMGRARSVTNNHLAETITLISEARLGRVPMPDFVLWPENSTDIDPLTDPITRATVEAAVEVADRPILVGAVVRGPGPDERQTSALWWDRDGVSARYDKRNLVPFGEWIPFRAQLLPFVPILKQVGAQSVPGSEPGVLHVRAAGREVAVGDVICFELAYDRTVYEAVRGSQLLVVQSNNATYGGTGQIEQQFAITRARAMEARREIAVATTNSVSGLVDRDGRVVRRTEEFTAASLVAELPLRSALTPALTIAPWIDRGLAAGAVLLVVMSVIARRRGPGRASATIGPENASVTGTGPGTKQEDQL